MSPPLGFACGVGYPRRGGLPGRPSPTPASGPQGGVPSGQNSFPMSPTLRQLWRGHWPALPVFVVSLAVYVRTLCPTVFVEGTGENIVAAWTLGVPHPPGFPLFCLLGKLFALVVPLGSVAYRVNLFAAVMGAGAAVILFEALRLVPLRTPAAAAAALAFAFSATFWRQATMAEVYTLSFCFVGLEAACLLRWRQGMASEPTPAPAGRGRRRTPPPAAGRKPDDRFLLWFALVFGLGLAVHYHHALLLPGYLVFILAHDRRVLRRGKTVLQGLGLTLAGFALHLYAPLRAQAHPPLNWGDPETLRAWWPYLTAAQYRGRMFHLPLNKVWGNLFTFLRDLPQEFWWLGLAGAVLGLVALGRRDRRLLAATGVTLLLSLVWAVNYDIPWEIDVYYLPALFVLAIWLGCGLEWLLTRTAGRLTPAAAAGLFLVPALALGGNFRNNDLSQQRFVLENAQDTLAQLPPHATLLLPSTNPTFALLYLTRVEHQRPDVQLWSRLERGVATVEHAVYPTDLVTVEPEARFVSTRLAAGEPVFSVERQPESRLPGIAQLPWVCLYRLAPAAEKERWGRQVPDPARAARRFDPLHQQLRFGDEHRLLASRYLLVEGDYLQGRGEGARAEAQYQQALRIGGEGPGVATQVAQRESDGGRLEAAAALYRRALARQEDADTCSRLGVVYGKQGDLAGAEKQFRRALELQPDLADAHANLASIYGRKGELQQAVAELEAALASDPAHLQALKNLGFAYTQLGQPDKARGLLERAVELDPTDAQVGELLRQLPAPAGR